MEIDKTIEVMKAAMEKEMKAKNSNECMDEKIDIEEAFEETSKETISKATAWEDSRMINNHQEDMVLDEASKEDNQNIPSKDDINSEDKSEDKPAKSGKSFLKSSKNKELEAKELKLQEMSDRLIRNMAEFDNFRKRSEKEKSQMYDLGVKSTIEKLLPVIDNFERGLGSVAEESKDSPYIQGFNMIYKQLMTTMDEIGVKVIEALGNEFDPNYHNAVLHGEDDTLGENIVAEEFQKGYMYHDIVVRHSMVKVVN